MSEILARFTSLPNLHPALVHFPIALLPVAVVLDVFLLALRGQREWLDRAASMLYLIAGVGAWAAYETGETAADSVGVVAPAVQLALNEHSDWGHYAFWMLGSLALVRTAIKFWDAEVRRLVPRAAVLVVGLGAVALVFRTADLGGRLVFRHGVAVSAAQIQSARGQDAGTAASASTPPAMDARLGAEERLVRHPDGSLEWALKPEDREALGSVLLPVPGSEGSVSWVEPAGEPRGLGLEIDGEALLLLPGSYRDVIVELEATVAGLAGEIGVVHHAQDAGRFGFLTLDVPKGEVRLGSREDGVERDLDRASRTVPSGTVRLSASALGRHLRGFLSGETIVHGHEPALPAGACGLLLRGRGTVRVVSMKVTPVDK